MRSPTHVCTTTVLSFRQLPCAVVEVKSSGRGIYSSFPLNGFPGGHEARSAGTNLISPSLHANSIQITPSSLTKASIFQPRRNPASNQPHTSQPFHSTNDVTARPFLIARMVASATISNYWRNARRNQDATSLSYSSLGCTIISALLFAV